MSVDRDEVLHVAKLAALAVNDAELPRLVEQMSRIVDYVAQLDAVALEGEVAPFLSGRDEAPLRPDEPQRVELARGPAELAPEFQAGFFLVPRHGTIEQGRA